MAREPKVGSIAALLVSGADVTAISPLDHLGVEIVSLCDLPIQSERT